MMSSNTFPEPCLTLTKALLYSIDMCALKKACLVVGGTARLAKILGVSRQAVSQWLRHVDQIPFRRCLEIEALTDRAVTCEELRPDIDWSNYRRRPDEVAA